MNLDSLVDAQILQASPGGWVFDRTVIIDVFNSRIGQAAIIFEKRRQLPTSDVAAFIDRSGKYSTSVFTVPNRVIGAAAKEGDTERSARYDHALVFLFFRWTVVTPRKTSAWVQFEESSNAKDRLCSAGKATRRANDTCSLHARSQRLARCKNFEWSRLCKAVVWFSDIGFM